MRARTAGALPIAPNPLSYHLKVLRDNGLVTTERRAGIDYCWRPTRWTESEEHCQGMDDMTMDVDNPSRRSSALGWTGPPPAHGSFSTGSTNPSGTG